MNLNYPRLNEFSKGNDPLETLGIGSYEHKQLESMHCLTVFLHNADHNFVEQVWGPGRMADHLENKLLSKIKNNVMDANAIIFFIRDLCEENEEKLFSYIIDKYKK